MLLVGGSLVLLCALRKTKRADKGIYALDVDHIDVTGFPQVYDRLTHVSSGDSTGTKKKGLVAYSAVRGGHLLDEGVAYFISLPLLEEATDNFSKRVGRGSFGSVYYGRMKDGKEVAVKITADPSSHLNRQFVTEVLTNLQLLTYCKS